MPQPARTLTDLSPQAPLYRLAQDAWARGDHAQARWLYHQAEMAETKGSAS